MALKDCKECKQPVSEWASKCPHCGVSNPTTSNKQMAIAGGAIILLVAAFAVSCSSKKSDSPPPEAAAKTLPVVDDATCRKDLQCWYERATIEASADCQEQIERFAKFDVEWTGGFLDLPFSHAKWIDQEKGVILLIGDKVKFQNGFGAWQRMTYGCAWDPSTSKVIDVKVTEGRL